MKPLLFTLGDSIDLTHKLASSNAFDLGYCEAREFPDGESYIRVLSDCTQRDVIILCSMHRPNSLAMTLLFCAETLRELGAKSVGLIAPYLAYMRQDIRFNAGEAINAQIFAKFISTHFDWLITVDPHLHRIHDLAEIYSIPQQTLSATPLLANWIKGEIEKPLLIGPDSESEQWVAGIAKMVDAPYFVLDKIRHGDRDVKIVLPDLHDWLDHTPILIDDIISTGQTMLEIIAQLRQKQLSSPICAAVHGLFSENAEMKLLTAGVQRIVTSNTIAHRTNAIDVSRILIEAVAMRPLFIGR